MATGLWEKVNLKQSYKMTCVHCTRGWPHTAFGSNLILLLFTTTNKTSPTPTWVFWEVCMSLSPPPPTPPPVIWPPFLLWKCGLIKKVASFHLKSGSCLHIYCYFHNSKYNGIEKYTKCTLTCPWGHLY